MGGDGTAEVSPQRLAKALTPHRFTLRSLDIDIDTLINYSKPYQGEKGEDDSDSDSYSESAGDTETESDGKHACDNAPIDSADIKKIAGTLE